MKTMARGMGRACQAILLTALAALAAASTLAAQRADRFQFSAGPAYRFRTPSLAITGNSGVEGIAAGLDWDRRLAGRLGVMAGLGAFWGTSAAGQLIVPPCLPQAPCPPPYRDPESEVSGALYDVRLGVSLAGTRFRAYLGGVIGHSPGGVERDGAGGFASFWLVPWSPASRLSLGLTAQLMDPAPGHTRAILSPRLGVRF